MAAARQVVQFVNKISVMSAGIQMNEELAGRYAENYDAACEQRPARQANIEL
jgi:hypothetical protein